MQGVAQGDKGTPLGVPGDSSSSGGHHRASTGVEGTVWPCGLIGLRDICIGGTWGWAAQTRVMDEVGQWDPIP